MPSNPQPPPPPPSRTGWKLHKGPSNPDVLVGQTVRGKKTRNENFDSEDVEEKTTSFYQNRAIEEYWMMRARERGRKKTTTTTTMGGDDGGGENITLQSRVEAMRNKMKHKHFQSTLDDVLRDPPEKIETKEITTTMFENRKEEEEDDDEDDEEDGEEEEETKEEEEEEEEEEDVRKMVEELKRLRSKAAAAATTSAEDGDEEEEPSWKTWYFPPTHEYGSFIPKMDAKERSFGALEEIESRSKNINSLDEDQENALREKKRMAKARQYQKSRNLNSHKLW